MGDVTREGGGFSETRRLNSSSMKAVYAVRMWLVALLALIFPRIAALLLYFFTTWFSGVFETLLWPVLGFIFAPYTMLWYSAVVNWYGGEWGTLQLVGLAIAILCDFGSSGKTARG